MITTRFSSPLGWIACGRGLRRSKQAFAAMSEYDVWVSDQDAIDGEGRRPDRGARGRQLGGDDPSPASSHGSSRDADTHG